VVVAAAGQESERNRKHSTLKKKTHNSYKKNSPLTNIFHSFENSFP
jgi:hypothetical protein